MGQGRPENLRRGIAGGLTGGRQDGCVYPRANEPGWYRCACGEWLHGPPALYDWCPVLRGRGRPMVEGVE